MSLRDLHVAHGATLAADGIPLHYGDLAREYEAALHNAVLLDRSHEGRLHLTGKSRFELLNRMSTNKMVDMALHEGRPTIFTNPNARIIDRIIAYNHPEHLFVITEPGQGVTIQNLLQRQIFFGDDVQLQNVTADTKHLALHGKQADAIMQALHPDIADIKSLHGIEFSIGDATIYAMQRKAISGSHWALTVKNDYAIALYEALLEAGAAYGLIPAGSLTYNTLRIRAGHPARPELNSTYIPLEIGLWDEVNFAKGCYTGQEIIARMESRGKLAKTIVALHLTTFVAANTPQPITADGKAIGMMTSSVEAPNGEIFALGIIKTQYATIGTELMVNSVPAIVSELVGTQTNTSDSINS